MASCAIMMEALRVISQLDVPLRHAIVLNFNGAEESVLQVRRSYISAVDLYSRFEILSI